MTMTADERYTVPALQRGLELLGCFSRQTPTLSGADLARQLGAKSVEPCTPDTANRHSGYLVGGTSPFATRKAMPVYVEETILGLPKILINGGRRGYLVGLDPQVCVRLLGAKAVQCALEE